MPISFTDYKIHIGNSNNYPGKYVAYIEELYNVSEIIEHPDEASDKIKPKFEKEMLRLIENKEEIPLPGSGKARITLADDSRMQKLRPFAEEFWKKIFDNDYDNYFVSDVSQLNVFEMLIDGERDAIIQNIKLIYGADISDIYDEPIPDILEFIKKKRTFWGRIKTFFKKWPISV